jgi:hypothetical protein
MAQHAYILLIKPELLPRVAYPPNGVTCMIVQQFRCWTHGWRISDPLIQRLTPEARNGIAPYPRPATDLQGDLRSEIPPDQDQ